ncbi:MAG: glycosyltransferase family 2 protein [Acidimicrobiia bacterium]
MPFPLETEPRRTPVSVILPTYNEELHIDACLDSVYSQTYGPSNLEVLVVDGGSADRTVELAEAWREKLPGLRVLDNPKRQQGAALNIALENATSDLIVRLDAHSRYATDYVERCIDALGRSDATVVGGPMRPEGETPFGEAVAAATTTPIGVGPGRFHYSEVEEFVDTVFLGAFRRSDIIAAGGYDEDIRQAAEDHELNFRITKSGGTILLDPTIRSIYRPRSSPGALWKQYHNYGQGKVSTLMKHRALPTWRPLVPALFVLGLITSTIWLAFRPTRLAGLLALTAYGALVLVTSVVKSRFRPMPAGRTAYAILIMHVSYGLGFLGGIARKLFGGGRSR